MFDKLLLIFGEKGGGQLDRRRARGVLNPVRDYKRREPGDS